MPEFSAGYSGLSITTLGFSQTLKIGNFVLDANNKPSLDTSKGYIQIATGENNGVNVCILEPRNCTSSSLGTSANKWKSFNGVEPSSLGMPADRGSRIDISSYFTDTSNGGVNRYTAPSNGFVYLMLNDVVTVHMYSQATNSSTNFADTRGRSTVGQLYAFLPVRKGDVFVSQWYTTATDVTVTGAYFIPCLGNI